jgi:hypothetical protein
MSAPTNDDSTTKGMNSPTLDNLAQSCLEDLYAGKLDEDGQRYAAEILGERLRRKVNTEKALG